METLNPTGKSAAEVSKPDLQLLMVSEADVKRLLDLTELLDALAQGFRDLAEGKVQTPNRPEIKVPSKGFLVSMAAFREGSPIVVKMVTVFEGNLPALPNHLAMINLFDSGTGAPLCVMDGTYITAMRTAASAVLTIREIARSNAKVATIVGAGVQGRAHLDLLPLVRDFEEIYIYSLYHDDAQKLADLHPKATAVQDLEDAVKKSHVVCLATHSHSPVLEASWVQPGTHVTSVGFAPPGGELPSSLAKDHSLFVEADVAFEEPPVGCAELKGMSSHDSTTLGDALLGVAPLRRSEEEITVYKSMGIAMEDMVAAELVYKKARQEKSPNIAII